jgi:serine/threonine protein kinase
VRSEDPGAITAPDPRRTIAILSPDPQEALVEAQILSSIDSEHFARLYRFLDTEKGIVAVMERVRGIDLRSILSLLRFQHRGLKPAAATNLLYQACRGLEDVHVTSALSLHPGLHCANLRLSRSGTLKWTGLEWRQRAPQDSLLISPERLPLEHVAQPSEQVTLLSDLYGLGATLFELLTGEPLYHRHRSAPQEEALPTPIPPVQSRLDAAAGLPPVLRPFLARALNANPPARFSTPREMADALAALSARLEPVPPLDILADRLYRIIRLGDDPKAIEPWLSARGDGRGAPRSEDLLPSGTD